MFIVTSPEQSIIYNNCPNYFVVISIMFVLIFGWILLLYTTIIYKDVFWLSSFSVEIALYKILECTQYMKLIDFVWNIKIKNNTTTTTFFLEKMEKRKKKDKVQLILKTMKKL